MPSVSRIRRGVLAALAAGAVLGNPAAITKKAMRRIPVPLRWPFLRPLLTLFPAPPRRRASMC